MVAVKKDLRVSLNQSEIEMFKTMVYDLGCIETAWAKVPGKVPLDVFLDFSELVSKAYSMYGDAIGRKKSVSWNHMNNLFTRLWSYYIDYEAQTPNTQDEVLIILSNVCAYIQYVREGITVADVVNR